MSSSAVQITNLLYRYAELVDRGRLSELEGLFRHAKFKMLGSDALVDSAAILAMLTGVVKIYDDQTPRTKHIVSNPILEIDEAAGKASCRSSYTVLQATPSLPLQVIAAGRYDDRFERIEGAWQFTYRDYTIFDFAGNVSGRLNGF